LKLLLLIHKDTTNAQEPSATDRAVDTARLYLEQHLSEDISLEALGEVTGYHPLYLQRIFKQAAGCTPHAYLTNLRLQRAKEALMSTAQPISQIAHDCGYNSISHFTNLFRKQVGCSPLTFRKRSKILP
jgi:AraC family transcriptional regulator